MKHSKYAPLQTPLFSLVIPIGTSISVHYLLAYSDAFAVPSCRTGSAGKNKSHVQLPGRVWGEFWIQKYHLGVQVRWSKGELLEVRL